MIILLIIIVALIVLVFALYNYIVKLNLRCDNAYAQIDNQLKRRIYE